MMAGGLIQAMFGSTNSLMAHGNSKALTLMDPLNKVLEITRISQSACQVMAPIWRLDLRLPMTQLQILKD